MVKELRQQFNKSFTQQKYEAFFNDLNTAHSSLQFRPAETPVFVPKHFHKQMISACESIIDVILKPDFKELTENSIPKDLRVKNEDDYPGCLTFDFGVCINDHNKLEPQLIEMQAFPTLFAYEVLLDDTFYKHFEAPSNYSSYLGALSKDSYLKLLKDLILKNHAPENVILLEIFPDKQKTNIDFYCTQDYLGIKPVCVTELIKKGKELYYFNGGKETLIKRIYNRVIFDELLQQEEWVQEKAKVLFEDIDVEWMPHPNWFYRISKYTLPLIKHPNIPETNFLNKIEKIPSDLENYVLKPLFSFAGQGVVIDVTNEDIEKIEDRENWILQRKVQYASVIETLDEPAKAEIRIFYFWPDKADRPIPTNNLVRLSKGKMIGVRYNKDKSWTGGTFGLFER
ncbi:hypothetical protein [Niabella ginsengisoli]|uniref:Circularly permuted type 2 ATP-grasp protein n=1 Tax=Niabella ginsengisoli TaxID=522298 RepID=A0ABS9SK89_9BACT|nr:hypothetical protein [Niabella ginsengisoli]MCH5598784.1 hypothetical protein [Niabella ginsengisoli]